MEEEFTISFMKQFQLLNSIASMKKLWCFKISHMAVFGNSLPLGDNYTNCLKVNGTWK